MAEQEAAEKGGGANVEEWAIAAALALIAFLASYYYFSSQLKEQDVRGLKFLSGGDPYSEMKRIFSSDRIIIKEMLYPGEDDRNSYVGVVAAEIAGVFSQFNRSVAAYGYVPEEPNASLRLILCTKDTDFCSNEKIVVQLSGCNCVKLEAGRMQVLYEAEKLKDSALRLQLRGVIGGVLQELEGEGKDNNN